MRPLVFTLPGGLAFWTLYVVAFFPEIRLIFRTSGPRVPMSPQDSASLLGIVLGTQLALLVAFIVALAVPGAAIPRARQFIFWTGLGFLAAGALLRRHCFRMLGEYFTSAVRARPDQPVVERGAYRWVRHPSYTAAGLMFVGIALALTNWLSLGIVVVAITATYAYRIHVEERVLLETLGERYRQYMRRTKRLVPFLF